MKKPIIILLLLTLASGVYGVTPIVEFVTPSIVRVRWNPEEASVDNGTGACIYVGDKIADNSKGESQISSGLLKVKIVGDKLSFSRLGKDIETELLTTPVLPFECDTVVDERIVYDETTAHMEDTANGKVTVKDVVSIDTIGVNRRFKVSFVTTMEEGLYGLGSHMEDYMNLTGKTLYLTQHNLKAFIPMLVSTKGYGLLFDAGCSMKYESKRMNDDSSLYNTSMEMEAANTIDFYFILGENAEEVVRGYRYLTGAVSMMPRYLFGYIQSKERYVSSADILNTLKEYRRRKVPIDMIVQDWNYWPEGWGYMKMNRQYYPDPRALADSVHSLNAKLMVSIWANPQYCAEEQDFRSRGFMLEHSVYDAFNPEARDLYWKYAEEEFFSKGFDAWWCDSSEPLDGDWNRMPGSENGKDYGWDDHERRWRLNNEILSESLGAERACLYALNHAKGIYEHQRATTADKRVVNLTRSTFAGQQRYSTILWNGDTYASWESFKRQIPAGLNYFATGHPYWTVDVGCFFTGEDGRWFRKGKFPQGVADDGYKEFYTRMFQWATFLPVLRSHGTDTPREIWQFGEPGTQYYDAILKMINLRYSLLPYTYSMAARQTEGGYSMSRPLAFDFPEVSEVYDIKDQYMFGDFMVCPVTDPGVATREVYLPNHDAGWFDYNSGKHYEGGETLKAATPIDRIPVFVKGGSIVLSTEPAQHSGATVGMPITVNVYPGKNAEFTHYDDAGDSYAFENGESMRIAIHWDDKRRRLTLERAKGTYPEAPEVRRYLVKVGGKEKKVDYKGKKVTLKF